VNGNHHRTSIRIPPYYSDLLFYYGKVDVTNEAPSIVNQTIEIHQSSFTNNYIGKVKASDADAGQKLVYSIVSGNADGLFRIDELTGDLYVQTAIDFASNPTYILNITVTDNGEPVMNTSASVTLRFIANKPADNQAPVIKDQGFNIEQNSFTGNLVGIVAANDPDDGQKLSFSIIFGNPDNLFRIDESTGYLYAQVPVDFSVYQSYDLTVQVKDDGSPSLSSAANIMVLILPVTLVHYIDPNNLNDPSEDGTISHPYDSWSDVTWTKEHTYLQKAGTTLFIDNFSIGASSVRLGKYSTGENPKIVFTTDNYGLRVLNKNDVVVQNLNFEAPDALYCAYMLGSENKNIEISNCRFSNTANGIKVVGDSIIIAYNDFAVDENSISSNALRTYIYYNLFKSNQVSIRYQATNSENYLYNNLFYGNKTGLIQNSERLVLYNNIFYMLEVGDQAINAMTAPVISDHNLYYPINPGFITVSNKSFNTLSSCRDLLNIEHNSIADDPIFYDAPNLNFSLSESSPVLDEGKNIGILTDYNGNPVPLGNTTDIGPYESKSSKPETNFMAYPNPASGNINIKVLNSNFEGGDLVITSLTGEVLSVSTLPAGNNHLVDLNKLMGPDFSGMCLIHIAAYGQVSFSQRILIFGK
jgi:hypothetical protein